MVTLVLVRHAKSDWGDPGLADHDRPLNERGLRDAPQMAQRLADTGFRPDAILSSTALRARTTAQFFGERLGVGVSLEPELYGAGPRILFDRAAATGLDAVLVVAHDPGMSALAGRLSDDAIGHMPTCAVAMFFWPVEDWDVVVAPAASWTFDEPRASR